MAARQVAFLHVLVSCLRSDQIARELPNRWCNHVPLTTEHRR